MWFGSPVLGRAVLSLACPANSRSPPLPVPPLCEYHALFFPAFCTATPPTAFRPACLERLSVNTSTLNPGPHRSPSPLSAFWLISSPRPRNTNLLNPTSPGYRETNLYVNPRTIPTQWMPLRVVIQAEGNIHRGQESGTIALISPTHRVLRIALSAPAETLSSPLPTVSSAYGAESR